MGNPGSKPTTPKPPTEDKSINAKEIIVRNEHNNYPALFNVDARNDHFGEPSDDGFPHFTVWPIVGAVVATLLLIYCVKKIRDCIHKSKAKKEAKKIAEQAARDDRLEAHLMTPLKFHSDRFEEINEKIDQLQMQKVVEVHPKDRFDRDRFEEINEKLEKVTKFVELPEKSGIATPPIVMAPPQVVPFADRISQIQNLPPVQFLDQAGPITPIQGLTFGNQMAQMQGLPALTYINEGRSRRNRGRRHWCTQVKSRMWTCFKVSFKTPLVG